MILLNLSINLGGKKTMKKVLSVLLAAAMVMGMSVSAFAANKVWGSYSTDDLLKVDGTKASVTDVAPLI